MTVEMTIARKPQSAQNRGGCNRWTRPTAEYIKTAAKYRCRRGHLRPCSRPVSGMGMLKKQLSLSSRRVPGNVLVP